MFINTAVFKRMIKKAWSGAGLTVGRDGEELFLEGGFWIIRMKAKEIPNKEKAAIIELTGELPGEGEAFKAMKGVGNQYEMKFSDAWNIRATMQLAETEFKWTNVLIMQNKTLCRVAKCMDSTGKCILMNDMFYDLIDYDAVDRQKETEPEGPFAVDENGTVMYWENGICAVAAYKRKTNEENYEEELMEALRKIEEL